MLLEKNIEYVDYCKVMCEDNIGEIGHPRVFLEIKDKQVVCPYCSKIFRLKDKKDES